MKILHFCKKNVDKTFVKKIAIFEKRDNNDDHLKWKTNIIVNIYLFLKTTW